jgi:uncharacterized UPF0146 family protein
VAYCYNEKLNTFIAVNKNELLNDLIDCRMYDIQKLKKVTNTITITLDDVNNPELMLSRYQSPSSE